MPGVRVTFTAFTNFLVPVSAPDITWRDNGASPNRPTKAYYVVAHRLRDNLHRQIGQRLVDHAPLLDPLERNIEARLSLSRSNSSSRWIASNSPERSIVISANLSASRVLRSHGRSSRSRPCQNVLISSSAGRGRADAPRRASAGSRRAGGHIVAACFRRPVKQARGGPPHVAGVGDRGNAELPATKSFESVAMSCLVTSPASFLPNRGLRKRRRWLATFSQLSIRGRISPSGFLPASSSSRSAPR